MPTSSDASQFTSFKKYSSARVDPRTDNKQVTHLYQHLSGVQGLFSDPSIWLAPLSTKNTPNIINNTRPLILGGRKVSGINQFFKSMKAPANY
jgi:hypothetical protein